VEDDVDVWCYTILELHARNDDDDHFKKMATAIIMKLSEQMGSGCGSEIIPLTADCISHTHL